MSNYIGSPEDLATKDKSRRYRGYREPQAVASEQRGQIVSATYDGDNMTQLVERVTMGGGERVTRTTVFTYTDGKLTGTNITYVYDDVTP